MDIKCVIVGDGVVGKSCLCKSFVDDTFPEGYSPLTIFHNTTIGITVHDINVRLELLDTPGQEDYDGAARVFYGGAWHQFLSLHWQNVPIVLVGTKLDERQNEGRDTHTKEIISKAEGERMAKKIKAFNYLECSSLTREGLKEVFHEVVRATKVFDKVVRATKVSDEVVRATLNKKSRSHKKCIIL